MHHSWIVPALMLALMACRRQHHGPPAVWLPPDTATIARSPEGDEIRYGRALIMHTARFFGPEGSLAKSANGMNCQNCHLAAGTAPWGNNFSAAWATYPKYRDRSGSVESLEKKINDCFERSLNGRPIDSTGPEMKAMVAYMRWLAGKVPRGERPAGSGITQLPWQPQAADPARGKLVYIRLCSTCHGADGQGKKAGAEFLYPPLWGQQSFNTGAGIFRISKMAGYIYNNMPQGTTWQAPVLTINEAWDVAAWIVSQPRPYKAYPADWPNIATKPPDHPFGPYADSFSETRHKYGPFGSMLPASSVKP